MRHPSASSVPLSRWDDFFIHQAPGPVRRPATEDPNWIERSYWNIADPAAQVMVGIGLGQYRNTGIMDAIVYSTLADEQRVLRLSRHVDLATFTDPAIGPLRLAIDDPFHTWTLTLEDNRSGLAFDLRFEAACAPYGFAPFTFGEGDGRGSHYQHVVQLGAVAGSVAIDGRTVASGEMPTVRDRSWGVRRARERQGLHLWLHHDFGDGQLYLIFNEHRDGSVAYLDGAYIDASGSAPLVAVGHDLDVRSDTRDIEGGVVMSIDSTGRRHDVQYERLLRGYVGGLGYGGWINQDRGPAFVEAERFDLSGAPEDVLARQPMLLFDHLCRVTHNGAAAGVGSFQAGITRSREYEYRPRALG